MELGTIEHYHPSGYGFIRDARESASSCVGEAKLVHFRLADCDIQTPRPQTGERVRFRRDSPDSLRATRLLRYLTPPPQARQETARSSEHNVPRVSTPVTSRRGRRSDSTPSGVNDTILRLVFVDLDSVWASFLSAKHIVCRFPGATKTRDLELDLEGFTRRLALEERARCVLRLVGFYTRMPDVIAAELREIQFNGVMWDVRKQPAASSASMMRSELLQTLHSSIANPLKTLVLVPGVGMERAFGETMDAFVRHGWCVEIHAWSSTMPASFTEYRCQNIESVVIRQFDDDNVGEIVRLRQGQANRTAGHSSTAPEATTRPEAYASGVIDYYDARKGVGFIQRFGQPPSATKVQFRANVVVDGGANLLKPGDAVVFIERRNPGKGPQATVVRRWAPRPHEEVGMLHHPTRAASSAMVLGVVVAYTGEGGFGSIAKCDGSNGPNLSFKITDCDIRRPPLQPGERVLVQEVMGPKGPRASVVRRFELPTAVPVPPRPRSATRRKSKPEAAPSQSALGSGDLAALMRMFINLSNEAEATKATRAQPHQPRISTPPPRPQSASDTHVSPAQYRAMIQSLSSPSDGVLYVPAGMALLARTRPRDARRVEENGDPEAQTTRLIVELARELDDAVSLETLEQRDAIENASFLDFGYTGAPPAFVVAAAEPPAPPRVPEPAPEPEPRTMHCFICMDEDPIEDIFVVTGCRHSYCRETIRIYILDRIHARDPRPTCPIADCDTVISDVDLRLVLTPEEQQMYYDVSINAAVNNDETLAKCIQENCRGVAALGPGETHFVCPLCFADRCTMCNTRKWHDGLTCAQVKQRGLDSELHPEQLRDIYGDNAYQCGQCSFGPIEHSHCFDLQTHHDQAVGNARINNACPRCGWFAREIAHWPRWDGTMHNQC